MAWCRKWLSGEVFFSLKAPQILHVLFNLVVKDSPDKERTNRGGKPRRIIQDLNRIKFRIWIFFKPNKNYLKIIRNKVQNGQKNVQGDVLLLNWKAHAKIQALVGKKNFTRRNHLRTLRAEPLLFLFALILITRPFLGTKHMYRKKRFCLQGVTYVSLAPSHSVIGS